MLPRDADFDDASMMTIQAITTASGAAAGMQARQIFEQRNLVACKRVVKVDSHGDAHVTASFNNIIISLTNKAGQVISWSSAGKMGFRGSKKNTPYAAQMAAADAAKAAMEAGLARKRAHARGHAHAQIDDSRPHCSHLEQGPALDDSARVSRPGACDRRGCWGR